MDKSREKEGDIKRIAKRMRQRDKKSKGMIQRERYEENETEIWK